MVWGVFVCFFGLRFDYFFFFLKRRAAAALGAGPERGHPPRSPRVRGAPGDPRPSPGPAPPRCPRGGSGRGSLPPSTEGGRGGSRRVEPRRRCRSAAGSRSPGPGRVGADPHQPPPPPPPRLPPGKPGSGAARPVPVPSCARQAPGSIPARSLVSPGQPGPGTRQRTNVTLEMVGFGFGFFNLLFAADEVWGFFFFLRAKQKTHLDACGSLEPRRRDALCLGAHGGFYPASANSPGAGAVRGQPGLGGCQAWGRPRARHRCPPVSAFRPGLSNLPFPVGMSGCVSAGAAAAPRPCVCF